MNDLTRALEREYDHLLKNTSERPTKLILAPDLFNVFIGESYTLNKKGIKSKLNDLEIIKVERIYGQSFRFAFGS